MSISDSVDMSWLRQLRRAAVTDMNATGFCRYAMAAAALLGAGVANAHDFWLQPDKFWVQPSETVPLTLQVGDQASQQRSQIPLRRITRFESVAPTDVATDRRADLRLRGAKHDGELRFDTPGVHTLMLETDNRAQSHLSADRFNAYLEEEGLTPALEHRKNSGRALAEGSERYSRRAKALLNVGTSVATAATPTQPLGLSLEIVPDTNLYAEPRPEKLSLRVFYEDAPLGGALVKLIDLQQKLQVTDAQRSNADGRVDFDMPESGDWLVSVTWTKPLPESEDVDFETTFSTLSFGLPPAQAEYRPASLTSAEREGEQ